uniref:histidine kinase n=1 Tax=uncultured bacterium Contig1756 TaxID=1393499 RepID=W0FH39_9BACT|nr:signal transduction histidine kinase [uncultured bacterium Contig1756]
MHEKRRIMANKVFQMNDQAVFMIRELGGHMPGGFFIYKAEEPGELLYANKPVFDIYGCDDLEDFKKLTGYTFRGMVHPEDYSSISASVAEQIDASDDNMDYVEYRIIRKDGAVRRVDDYGHYLETDAYGGVYTVFISDITEKHERIMSELEGHKATIVTLNETIGRMDADHLTFSSVAQALAGDYFSIYVVDPDTEAFVEYSSSEEYKNLGIETQGANFFELSRRNIEALIYPEDRDRFMAVFSRERVLKIIERDGHFTTKYRLMLNGIPTYVSMKATLLENRNERRLIIGLTNIDAQMKREEEFRKHMADARTRAKNDFLANMSHDIRTPMNAIVGYTNIAKSHWDEPEVVADALDKIGSSSHFLLSLINDILDISKIESGKMQLSLAACDLRDIFRRIEDITALQAKNKSITITYSHDTVHHYKVMADDLRIEQVLINITGNAIKYTPEGKSVELIAEELGETEDKKIKYRFIVRDTGIGISKEYLPHIFESFTREEKTTVNRVQGTGLGLAITARVVEMMGGVISVKSRPGEGSEFTVELALEPSEPDDDTAEPDEMLQSDLNGKRVLLVEDNAINAEIATIILEQYGIVVDHAENGRIGADKAMTAEAGYYSAVLMDIQMPVMNGYEATRAIRSLPGEYYRTLPIIAMSANAYDEDIRASLDSGMNAHIAKPFQPDDLIKTLCRYIVDQ